MTLKNGQCVVKFGNNLSERFDAKRCFRQGHSLFCDFFNILMDRIICASGLRHTGKIFHKSVMAIAELTGRSDREVAVAFFKFAKEARSMV